MGVCLLLTLAAASGNVKVLDPSNFDTLIKSPDYDAVIVEFYAPWCGHCKHLEPEYAKAADELHSAGKRIALANVDATAHEKLGSRYEVRGFPTLKVFRGDPDKPEEYDGPRDAAGIVKYALELLAPLVSVVTEEAAVKQAAAANAADGKRTVVAYADDNTPEAAALEAAGREHRKYFRFVRAPAAAKPENGQQFGIISEGEDTIWHADAATLKEVLLSNRFALVAEISQKNYGEYVGRGLPIVWAFVHQSDAAALATEVAALRAAAAEQKGKASVVYLDGQRYAQMASKLGLSGNVVPAVAVENADKAHWHYDEAAPFSSEGIAAWLRKVLAGEIKPTVKSAPKPEQEVDAAGVTTLVGDTFAAVAGSPTKDVLIEFYAPWCGHCKQLAPEYDKLGTLVKKKCGSTDEVVIAKMDATANDVALPGYPVNGYPTIFFAPGAEAATPIAFNGDRTVSGFAQFIGQHGKTACAAKLARAVDDDDDL